MQELLRTDNLQKPAELRAHHLLVGAANFREIGGSPIPDGLRVRHGQVFRSDELSRLTDEDLAVIRDLAIRLVFDLRSDVERSLRPSKWPQDMVPEFLHGSLSADIRAGYGQLRDILVQDPSADGARLMMLATYRLLPSRSAAALGQLIRKLVDGCAPALIHCTAGKDRTGFVCACLQHALGVPREAIFADYLLSGERLDLDAMAVTTSEVIEETLKLAVSRPVLDVVNAVSHEYLDAAFASIDASFGSLDAYLEHCGAGVEVVQQLRQRLLEPVV